MTFTSYAQNFEDVILRRALQGIESGFYVDVGANDPVIDSVTKAFYDEGWRGINIEPVRAWIEKLQAERPRDINLQLAASNAKGELPFYDVVGTGLSTLDKALAEQSAAERGLEVSTYTVEISTLAQICKENAEADIHFLKIDVEGAERAVLQGLDLDRTRPWIILVESTLPNASDQSYGDWHDILEDADYQFCYFDGLNRFYVASEHTELIPRIQVPPNFFDDFVVSGTGYSPLHNQVGELAAKSRQAESILKDRIHELGILNEELKTMQQSASWRITEPLRLMHDRTGGISGIGNTLLSLPRQTFDKLAQQAMLFTLKHPGPTNKIMNWLYSHPRIYSKLLSYAYRVGVVSDPIGSMNAFFSSGSGEFSNSRLATSSARTKKLYRQLKMNTETVGEALD